MYYCTHRKHLYVTIKLKVLPDLSASTRKKVSQSIFETRLFSNIKLLIMYFNIFMFILNSLIERLIVCLLNTTIQCFLWKDFFNERTFFLIKKVNLAFSLLRNVFWHIGERITISFAVSYRNYVNLCNVHNKPEGYRQTTYKHWYPLCLFLFLFINEIIV
jgi:hypothetical protein